MKKERSSLFNLPLESIGRPDIPYGENAVLSTRESMYSPLETKRICNFLKPDASKFKPTITEIDLSSLLYQTSESDTQSRGAQSCQGDKERPKLFQVQNANYMKNLFSTQQQDKKPGKRSLFERNQDWLKNKQKKLHKLKKTKERKELHPCTFSPYIKRLGDSSPSAHRTKQTHKNTYTNLYRDKLIYRAFNP